MIFLTKEGAQFLMNWLLLEEGTKKKNSGVHLRVSTLKQPSFQKKTRSPPYPRRFTKVAKSDERRRFHLRNVFFFPLLPVPLRLPGPVRRLHDQLLFPGTPYFPLALVVNVNLPPPSERNPVYPPCLWEKGRKVKSKKQNGQLTKYLFFFEMEYGLLQN